MKIAIVDDEQHCIDSLLAMLESYGEKITAISCYHDVATAVSGIESFRPDLLFLDVQLGDKTGFDILRKVAYRDFSLVFTTAFEQYAINAFKFSAIDYLLKPVAAADLDDTMARVFRRSEKEALSGKVQVLMSHLEIERRHQKICIPTLDGYVFLKVSDIIRCQSEVNYTYIFTTDGQKYVVSKTLKYFEELLDSHRFFRIHNSHMVNLDYVQKYTKGKSGYVTLSDRTVLEVSVRRKDEFLKRCRLS